MLPQKTPVIRHPVAYQGTNAVVSWQAKVPVAPAAGTTSLNSTQLASASAPTIAIRSGQSKLPN